MRVFLSKSGTQTNISCYILHFLSNSCLHSSCLCLSVIMWFMPVIFCCRNIFVIFSPPTIFSFPFLADLSLLLHILGKEYYVKLGLNEKKAASLIFQQTIYPYSIIFQFALFTWRVLSFLHVELHLVWLNISVIWDIFRYMQVSVQFKLCFRKFSCFIQVPLFSDDQI